LDLTQALAHDGDQACRWIELFDGHGQHLGLVQGGLRHDGQGRRPPSFDVELDTADVLEGRWRPAHPP
jgi:hypothetical protein